MPIKVSTKMEESPLEKFRKVFTEVGAPKGGLPTMQPKISETTSDELGDMIARYSSWREFTEDRRLDALATYSQLQSEADRVNDEVLLSAEGLTVTERKAAARNNSRVKEALKKADEARMYLDLLTGKLESFNNVLAILSRELTRRGINV